jgi:hypothetical protein
MMEKSAYFSILAAGLLVAAWQPSLLAQDAKPDSPETVLATFRVRVDQIDAFLQLMPKYRAALRENNLVTAEPYLLLQGEEGGKPLVVEVFSWRNHEIPEHVPPEIQVYWNRINTMVEDRNSHKGIEFPEMHLIHSQDP